MIGPTEIKVKDPTPIKPLSCPNCKVVTFSTLVMDINKGEISYAYCPKCGKEWK